MKSLAQDTGLTQDLAGRFAGLALAHVEREYPNKLDHVLDGPQDVLGPRALHPIFFGSFDWHSCLHGYWLLARALRRFPDHSRAQETRALLARRVTAEAVEAECAYLARPSARWFERPYGWAWALALQAELELSQDAAAADAGVRLAPFARAFAQRFHAFLPLADYPIRTGTHGSTAFALRISAGWARAHDPALFDLMQAKALAWYGGDEDARAFEPSQDDFLSPTLMEAECMRRFIEPRAFQDWFARFLPNAGAGAPRTLFEPARVSDRSDGKIAHLDGLNLSRAWCWRALAAAFPDTAFAAHALAAVGRHLQASLPHVAGDYMGEHWLATFAMLAVDGLDERG